MLQEETSLGDSSLHHAGIRDTGEFGCRSPHEETGIPWRRDGTLATPLGDIDLNDVISITCGSEILQEEQELGGRSQGLGGRILHEQTARGHDLHNTKSNTDISEWLFVTYLPTGFDSGDLVAFFKERECKGFRHAYVVTSKSNHLVGYANFDTSESAQEALAKVDGSNIHGKRLKVRFHKRIPPQLLLRRSPPPTRPSLSDRTQLARRSRPVGRPPPSEQQSRELPSTRTPPRIQSELTPIEEEAKARSLLVARAGKRAADALLRIRDAMEKAYSTGLIEFRTKTFVGYQIEWIDRHFARFMEIKHEFKTVADLRGDVSGSRNIWRKQCILVRAFCGIWETLNHITLMSRCFPEQPSLPKVLQGLFRDITPVRHQLTHSFETTAHGTIDFTALFKCINEHLPMMFGYYTAFRETWVVYGGAGIFEDAEADYDPIESSYTKY
jgi:hypothetical protein